MATKLKGKPAPYFKPAGAVESTSNSNASGALCPPAEAAGVGLSQAAIAQKAYEIWLARGQEPGRDQQHWFEAEQQLQRH
jgi:hypothetical protein